MTDDPRITFALPAPPIPPGSAPGGLLFRLVDHDGTVLSNEPVPRDQAHLAEMIGAGHGRTVRDHVAPGRSVRLNVFDGDSGACVYSILYQR